MTDQELIALLDSYGHLRFNPLCPEGRNLTDADVLKLTIKHPIVVAAIASYQRLAMPILDGLVAKHHAGRMAVADGGIGPATSELFNLPRCGEPDFRDPSKLALRASSRGWPMPCQKTGITFSVDYATVPSGRMEAYKKVLLACVAGNAQIGLRMVEVPWGEESNLRLWFRAFGGSTIGMAQFPDGTCGDSVWTTVSNSFWPNDATFSGLQFHEIGHSIDLEHEPEGIMNPWIIHVNEFKGWYTFANDRSLDNLIEMYGGEPIEPEPPPTPPPGPQPPVVIDEFVISSPGTYQIIRKGSGPAPGPGPVPT